jgi:tRNA threonylcarbamoyladenosine biosynthesis protein TsaB
VITLALDTATSATAVALSGADGRIAERRDEPPVGARPQHAQRLLELAAELLAAGGLRWSAIERVAVGVGPGGYTGLRIGIASARGIALAHGASLVGVGTLRALAEPHRGRSVAAVLDARRGELFFAVYRDGVQLLGPRVCQPAELPALLGAAGSDTIAVGDGALRFREVIEGAGVTLAPSEAPTGSPHQVSAAAICRLADAEGVPGAAPDYQRLADAELALGSAAR